MSETHVRKVRPYTAEEVAATERHEGETLKEKMARRELTHKIDVLRYIDAAYAHEEITFHMQRMADVGANAIEGWKCFYDTSVPEVKNAIILPAGYQGAEVGVSWTALHDQDVFDVFEPGTYDITPDALAEQQAIIAAAEAERITAAS